MSAPGEDTFANKDGEMEEMDEVDSDEDEMEEEGTEKEEGSEVYVPGLEPLQPGEELEMDRSAYRMYHECQTGKSPTHCDSESAHISVRSTSHHARQIALI